MAVYTIQDTTLTDIADAIREKTGQVLEVEYPMTNSVANNISFDIVKDSLYRITVIPTELQNDGYGKLEIHWVDEVSGTTYGGYCNITDTRYVVGEPTEFIITSPGNGTIIKIVNIKAVSDSKIVSATVKLAEVKEDGTLKNKYKPTEMADAINEMAIVPDEAFHITGTCQYRFAYNNNLWLLKNYGEKITTEDITTREYMFYNSTNLEEIPFDINLSGNNFGINYSFANCSKLKKVPAINGEMCSFTQAFAGCYVLEDIPNMTFAPQSSSYGNADGAFKNCRQLKNVPYIYNLYPENIADLFYGCYNIRTLPEDYTDTWNWSRLHTYSYSYGGSIFYNCYSLRNVPATFLRNLWNLYTSSYANMYYQLFDYCYSLDEVKELGVSSASLSSNVFGSTFFWCSRLKDFTFKTNEDGTPQTAKWKSQTIDLSQYVGYSNDTHTKYFFNYNAGITADKEVFDDITYQLLKDDPDWFSVDLAYSRYNHDSAVNTINSLPDCSATGTNIIKFKGQAGSATDGGAVNTLTEEEIAVATAKGWTVSLV